MDWAGHEAQSFNTGPWPLYEHNPSEVLVLWGRESLDGLSRHAVDRTDHGHFGQYRVLKLLKSPAGQEGADEI